MTSDRFGRGRFMYFQLNVNSKLDVPGREVWDVLRDFGGYYRFNPLIKASPIINGISHGVGAERRLELYDGTILRQQILDIEDDESLLISVLDSNLPIHAATARFTVEPVDQPFCSINVDVTFEPRYGPAGIIWGMAMKSSLRSQYNIMFHGLRHYLNSGHTVAEHVHGH